MLGHMFGLLHDPQAEWKKLAEFSDEALKRMSIYFIFLGMIPAIGFYIGTTQFGWTIGSGDAVRITEASAIPLAVLFYFALMGALVFIGLMIHWMSKTYSASLHAYKGFVFIGLCSIPVFLAGAFAAYPIWWLDIVIATAACSYAIRLIYLGIPAMMKVPEELGFLYASAVFAVALVYVVFVLVATVLLWEYVAAPVFTN
ncbi:MAG: Yip1 family protein [Porticoccus sp.]